MHESQREKTTQNIHALAEEFGDEVPTMDDFFGGGGEGKKETDPNSTTNQNTRKSMILPQRKIRSQNMDTKVFDQKLVDRALTLLLDYQQTYQFSIVKC
jgi:hypothetical protein